MDIWRNGVIVAVLFTLLSRGVFATQEGPYLYNFVLKAFDNLNYDKWSMDYYGGDPCLLPPVACNTEGYVTRLILASFLPPLNGTLSPYIRYFPYLQELYLNNNNLTGEVPWAALGELSNLRVLDLSSNSFTGTIKAVGSLPRVADLRLQNNLLSGTIPAAFKAKTCEPFLGNSNLVCPSDFASAAPVNAPVQESPPPPASSSSLPAIIGGVVAGIACLLLLLIGVWWWWRRQQQQRKMKGSIGLEKGEVADPLREEILGHLQQLQRFRLEDLRKATGGFGSRQLLGEGGYGLVYRGALEDGKQVAVKLLKKEKRGSEEAFVNEVNAISCAVHRNLLRLEGFCVDKGERLLVFPFLPHGSVADYLKGGRLRDKTTLTWKHRRNIVLGTAEGLAYMHTDCTPRLIHCDVKAENVLLTKDNDPVICDFGLSKLVEVEVPSIPKRGGAGAAVRGTLGHLAPEVYATGKWSEKSDVFGFGVLLVELIAGSSLFDLPMSQGEPQGEGTGGSGKDQRDQKESGEGGGRKGTDEQGGATEEIKDVGGEKEKQAKQEEVEEEEREKAGDDMTLREWVTCEMQQGHVNTLVDVQIRSHPADCDPLEVQVFLHVALLCLQQSPTDRPTMSECVTMLQGTGLACRWQLWGNGMEEGMRPPDMPTPDGVVSDSGDSYLPLDISGPR